MNKKIKIVICCLVLFSVGFVFFYEEKEGELKKIHKESYQEKPEEKTDTKREKEEELEEEIFPIAGSDPAMDEGQKNVFIELEKPPFIK